MSQHFRPTSAYEITLRPVSCTAAGKVWSIVVYLLERPLGDDGPGANTQCAAAGFSYVRP